MESVIYSLDKSYRVVINHSIEKTFTPDDDEFYNGCKLFLSENRYFFPESAERLETDDIEELEKQFKAVVPVYIYVHSLVALSHKPFNCKWDSGLLGYCCCDDEELAKDYIKAWHDYFNVEVYDVRLEEAEDLFDKDGNKVDQRWKFIDCYGEVDDPKGAFEEIIFGLNSKGIEFEDFQI